MANKKRKNSQLVEKLILFASFLAFAGLIVAYCFATEYVPAEESDDVIVSFQSTSSNKNTSLPEEIETSSVSDVSSKLVSSFESQISVQLINIKTATLAELETLPGIGPKKAQAIIDFRENVSVFYFIEDIMFVSGIGEKTFEKFKDLICVE